MKLASWSAGFTKLSLPSPSPDCKLHFLYHVLPNAKFNLTVIPSVSTLAALLLDLRTLHQSRYRGKYNPMLDEKMRQHVVMETLHDSSYREPSLEFPEYSHEVKKPYKVQRPIEAQHFGYSAPSEQTAYDGPGGAMHGGYGNGNGF